MEKEQVEKEDKTDQQSSIKVNKTTKGDYGFEVKVYSDSPIDIEHMLDRYIQIVKGSITKSIVEEGGA